MIEVMETEKLLASGARVDLLPKQANVLVQLGESAPDRKGPPQLVD